jgi:hypothetical protein
MKSKLDKLQDIRDKVGTACVTVKGELLFELESNNQWINRVPDILPEKKGLVNNGYG